MPSLRGLLILLLLVTMDLLAGFSLLVGSSLLDGTALPYSTFWYLLGVGVWGVIIGLLGGVVRLKPPWERIVLVGDGLPVLALAILIAPNRLALLLAGLILAVAYWRGIAVTQEPPSYAEVRYHYGLGFAALFAGIVWVVARGIIDQRAIWVMLAEDGVAFILISMSAMSIARISTQREPGAAQAVMVAAGVQLGILLVLSLLALSLLSANLAAWLGQVLHPVLVVLGAIMQALILVLITPLLWLIGLLHLHAHQPHHLLAPTPPVNPHGNGKHLHTKPSAGTALTVIALGFVALLFACIAFLIWRAVPARTEHKPEEGFEEERAWLWSLSEMLGSFRRWLRKLFHRGKTITVQSVSVSRQRLFPRYPQDPVRRIYFQVLRRARAAGTGRAPATTPAEFQQRFAAHWPEGGPDIATITEIYMLRRYGEVTPTPLQVARAQEGWEHLRALLRRPKPRPPATATDVQMAPAVPTSQRLRQLARARRLGVEVGIWVVALLAPFILLVAFLFFILFVGR